MSRLPRLLFSPIARSLITFALVSASLLPASAQRKPAVGISQTALSPAVIQQIAAFCADKETRTVAQTRIDSNLLYAIKLRTKQKLPGGVKTLRTGIEVSTTGLTLLDAQAVVNAALTNDIVKTGGIIVYSSAQWHSVRFWYSLDKLEKLAAHPEFRWIRPAERGTNNIGSVTSEGDITHRANDARSYYSINGNGVKVGVLSDSVDFFARSQMSGDLGTVNILSGQQGTGAGEGTAMMEIVHDLAPGAALYFATAASSPAQFTANIRALRDNGCQIIVDDYTYFNESPFQDDLIAQAVQDVANSGILYFSSAGNYGNLANNTSSVWEGDFFNSGQDFTYNGNIVGKVHTFGGSVFNTINPNTLIPSTSKRVNLFWNDPLAHSGNDYDVYALDAGNNVIGLSNNRQSGSSDPYESILSVEAGCRLIIVGYHQPQPRYLHLNAGGQWLQYATNGRITGHNGTAGMLSVAAVDVHTTASGTPFIPAPFVGGSANPVEYFSSEGPRRMFFSADGTPYTPSDLTSTGGSVLNKPDIAAADGGVTSFPAGSGFNPFSGTSAAAPHAAAIAALLKSYNPNATAAQISNALIKSARDIMLFGWDTTSGAGIVGAFDAIGALIGGDDYLFNRGSKTDSFLTQYAGQSRTYAFTLEDDTDNVRITATNGQNLGVYLTFYDQDGTTSLAEANNNSGQSFSLEVPHLGRGTYFIKVSQVTGTGTYTLSNSALVFAPQPNDTELNDTYLMAYTLPYRGEKRGRLGYSRNPYDVIDHDDWYKVTVTDESDFTVTAQILSGEMALNVLVYDQDGTELLADVEGDYGTSVSCTVPHIGPGTYYVQVQLGDGFGSYRLSNSIVTDPIPSDQEPNDDAESALVLPYGGIKRGRLGYSRLPYSITDDEDWYKVTVPSAGDFTVTAHALTSELAADVFLYGQDKTTLLSYAYGSYGSSPSCTTPNLAPGTYYVQVHHNAGYGAYSLTNAGATLSGTLTLTGISTGAPSQPFRFTFRPSDNSGDITLTINVPFDGSFTIPDIPRKEYVIHIKGARYLAKNVVVNLSEGDLSNLAARLRPGDATDDNAAEIADLLMLIAAYNKLVGQGGYNDFADFNLDGANDISDLLLLISNYNQRGDN